MDNIELADDLFKNMKIVVDGTRNIRGVKGLIYMLEYSKMYIVRY